MLPEENQNGFDDFLADAELILNDPELRTLPRTSISRLAQAFEDNIYITDTKMRALGLKHIRMNPTNPVTAKLSPWEERTIELRPLRAQRNLREFLRGARLITGRVEYLWQQQLKDPNFLVEPGPVIGAKYTQAQTAARLKDYVESGGQTIGDIHSIIFDQEIAAILGCERALTKPYAQLR